MEEKRLQQARATFATLCRALESNDWHYTKDEEKLKIECGARGEDLPMELTILVDAERQIVRLLSHIPFQIKEDKRLEVAVAVSAINNKLVDGCFDYDIRSGDIYFRATNSFMDSSLSEEVLTYMLYFSCNVIDEFNDKLLMLAKGMLTIEQFYASLTKE